METMVVVNGMTAHRANVIYARTGSAAMGVVKATQNGRGLSGNQVNTVKYWDVEKGGYRSLRFENLIQVF